MGSQTARSMDLFRSRGFMVEKVEQVVHGTFIKRDMFGFADLIALHPEMPITAVQVCASDRKADHVAKIRFLEPAWVWLRCGGAILIHAWRKRRERHPATGNWSAPRWAVVEMDLTIHDLLPEPDWEVVRKELAAKVEERRAAALVKRATTIAKKKLATEALKGASVANPKTV